MKNRTDKTHHQFDDRDSMLETVPFYNVTSTPHYSSLGSICIHQWAAFDNTSNIIECVQPKGPYSVHVTDYLGNNLLHYAAAADSYHVAQKFISYFGKPFFYNEQHITPAHISAQRNNIEMLKIYQQTYPEMLTTSSKRGWTPFHFAVFYGSFEAVDFLLQTCQIDVNQLIISAETAVGDYIPKNTLRYYSALDLAYSVIKKSVLLDSESSDSLKNYQKIVDLLLQHHALPSLHAAVRENNLPAIGFHLFSPLSPFKDSVDAVSDYQKATSLHFAAALGNYQVCHSLLQRGCSATKVDENGYSPLELAVIGDSEETVDVLIPFSTPAQYAKGAFLAADLQKTSYLEKLIKQHISPSAVDDNNDDNLVMRLIKRNLFDFATKLLQESKDNFDIKHQDLNGATLLHYGLASNNKPLIKAIFCLKNSETLFHVNDNNGMPPLTYAQRVGLNLQQLFSSDDDENIKKKIAEIDQCDVDALNNLGISPIVYSVSIGLSPKLIPTEKSKNAKYYVNVQDVLNSMRFPQTKMRYPDYKNYTFIEIPLQKELSYTSSESKNLPDCAHAKKYIEIATDEKCTVHSRLPPQLAENPCLLPAVTLLHLSFVFLTRSGKLNTLLKSEYFPIQDLIDQPDGLGRTPIMYALMLSPKYIYIEALLVTCQANITLHDNDGNSLYHYIDNPDYFEQMRKYFINSNLSPFIPNKYGELPIHTMCRTGCLPVLKQLVSLMQELDPSMQKDHSMLMAKTNDGQTPLDIAFEYKNYDCMNFLHSNGVPNLLVEAVRSNKKNRVEELLTQGYPVNSFNKQHQTPLHIAAEIQSESIVSLLIANGAEPNIQTLNGLLPIHIAANKNNIEICLLLLTEKFKISALAADNQPFLHCTEEKCRDFLFNMWKRELLSEYLVQYLDPFYQILQNGFKQILEIDSKLKGHSDSSDSKKHKTRSTIAPSLIDLIHKMCFISLRILDRGPSRNLPYSYRYSLHHLLQVLTTFNLEPFSKALQEQFSLFVDELKSIKFPLAKVVYYLLMPFYWADTIATMLKLIRPHLVEGIDNFDLFDQILTKINKQQSECEKTLQFGIPRESDTLQQALRINPVKGSHDTNVIAVVEAKIIEVTKRPLCLFHPQSFEDMKLFFGNQFSIPRNLPFKNKETIRIILCENSLTFVGKSSIKLPLFFVNIKKVGEENNLVFITPIGELKVTFSNKESYADLFRVSVFNRSNLVHKFEHGELALIKSQDKLYQCVVVYRSNVDRSLNIRFLTIRAGAPQACYDVCRLYLLDILPARPVFFNVLAREITQDESITYC